MFRRTSFRTVVGAGLLVACCWAALGTVPALASTGGDMPWDPLLDRLVANIGGPTLARILVLAIILAGIGFYFAGEGTWLRTAFGLIIGFSIACSAATWGPSFFNFAQAATLTPPLPPPLWLEWVGLATRLSLWYGMVTVLHWRLQDLLPGVRERGFVRVKRSAGCRVPGAEDTKRSED